LRKIGIEVGLKHFLTDSRGKQIENPKFYQKTLERIKLLQHWLSRKKKGSKNREKQRIKLAKICEKLIKGTTSFTNSLASTSTTTT